MKTPQYTKYSGAFITFSEPKSSTHSTEKEFLEVAYSVGIRLAAYFAVSFATAFVVMLGGKAIRFLLPKIKTRAASLLLGQ